MILKTGTVTELPLKKLIIKILTLILGLINQSCIVEIELKNYKNELNYLFSDLSELMLLFFHNKTINTGRRMIATKIETTKDNRLVLGKTLFYRVT